MSGLPFLEIVNVLDLEKKKSYCKDWELENNTNLNSIFCLIKSSEIVFNFFTCILPDYMAHGIPKEF